MMGFIEDIFEGVAELVTSLPEAFAGAVSGFGEAVSDMVGTAIGNFISQVDNVLKDILKGLLDLPEAIIDSVTRMFKSREFWVAVIIFLVMVCGASGLASAQAAVPGARWAAFLEGTGAIYHGWKLDFVVKIHRLAFLVSPRYREGFLRDISGLQERFGKAGIDIGYATHLFYATGALVQSLGAMSGHDWNWVQEEWAKNLVEIGKVSSQTLQEWSENPEAMVDWLDENLVAPAGETATSWLNSLSTGLEEITDATSEFMSEFDKASTALGAIAKDIDALRGTHIYEDLEKGILAWSDVLVEEWKTTESMLKRMSDILDVEVKRADGVMIADITTTFLEKDIAGRQVSYEIDALIQSRFGVA